MTTNSRKPGVDDAGHAGGPVARAAADAIGSSGRRDFLRGLAAAGAALGLPPMLASCGGSGSATEPVAADPPPHELRTLFFNFAHEAHAGKRYFYEAGGRSYDLVPVADRPEVLARARVGNRFLRAVPDDQITHHAEDVMVPAGSSMLGYGANDIDRAAGTWSMSSVYLQASTGAIRAAHALTASRVQARGLVLGAAAQRARYGLPAANEVEDLIEQSVLLDPTVHAATLIGVHPELMALDPTACMAVQQGHIQYSIYAIRLARKIGGLGPALPGGKVADPRGGWATLSPLVDPATGVQARVTTGPDAGRLQYRALWHPEVAAIAGQGIGATLNAVKDDPSLGADISNGPAPDGGRGALWVRRDGTSNVRHAPNAPAAAGAGPRMTLKDTTSQGGITLGAVTADANGTPQVTVTVENWYLRYLGVYVQFLDAANPPNVLMLASVPEYAANQIVLPARSGDGSSALDSADTMFMTTVGPVTTIMGIPIESAATTGSSSFTLKLPQKATTVRVLSGGLGGGSLNYPQTVGLGAGLTATFNYGFTYIFAAAGAASSLDEFEKFLVSVLGDFVVQLASLIADAVTGNDPDDAQFWIDQGETLGYYLLGYIGNEAISKIVLFVVGVLTLATLEKAVPIADMAMAALSALIGFGDILATTTEVALSPWTYASDIVYSHDLSVALSPSSGTFPAAADTCKVTAMFDDGTPHVQSFALPTGYGNTLPPVVFRGVPLGGNVNVSASFSQGAINAAAADILLGKGSTGLQPNIGDALTLSIDQIEFPIGPTTTYRHRQKTQIDDSGRHVWVPAPAPTTTAAAACGDPGTICALRSISVRQQTRTDTGYLGYAFQSRNADPSRVPSCVGGGSGQLDQVANLATGTDPQSGYALGGCGFGNGGVHVAYSLLSQGASNFYLDTTDRDAPLLRQVVLSGTPTIESPVSGRAWGALNMASDLLLLHPSGHAVSINGAHHKIETHRLPRTAASDAVAKVSMLAQIKSGKGSRPGLIDTPVTAAVSADGTLLILEAKNNRIQAMNLGANAVPYFAKQSRPWFLSLDATPPGDGWQHLDMAIEFTGFIYVLSTHLTTGTYRMNIYHPSQDGTGPVAMATSMTAGRLTVDFWRNVYTLNYEVIQRTNASNPSPVPVTEPSTSLWTPCDVGRTCPA